MNSTSNAVTWQSWSQKWGHWTGWFRKSNEVREPEITTPILHFSPVKSQFEKSQKARAKASVR